MYTPSCWPKFGYGAWSSKWLLAQSFARLLCLPAVLWILISALSTAKIWSWFSLFAEQTCQDPMHLGSANEFISNQTSNLRHFYVRSNASPIAGASGLDKRHAQRLGALKMQSEIRRFRQIFSLAIQHHSFRSWPLSRMATLDFYGHRRRWRLANRHWKHEIGSAFESPRRMLLEDRNISTRHTHQDLLLGPPWLTFFKPLQYNYTMQAAFFGILCHLNQRVG